MSSIHLRLWSELEVIELEEDSSLRRASRSSRKYGPRLPPWIGPGSGPPMRRGCLISGVPLDSGATQPRPFTLLSPTKSAMAHKESVDVVGELLMAIHGEG